MAILKTNKGDIKFRQKNIYLGIKRINKEISYENLLLIKNKFDENNIKFGLIYGTLLGAIRENDFISHDEDIDLFVLSEDEIKFREILFELNKNEFELIRYERSGLYSILRKGEYIDFYIMKPYSKGVRWNGADNFILEKFVTETKFIKFKGEEFLVPKESEKFLEFFYGKEWGTPIVYANFEISKFRIFLIKLFFIIRRSLPNFIYSKYIFFYYRKRYKKLLLKCNENRITLK